MKNTEAGVSEELVKYGFKGKLLNDLLEVIVDDETMQDFFNFILLKGEGMSQVMLVHKFKSYLQDKQSFRSCDEFVEMWEVCSTTMQKQATLAKLFVRSTTNQQLEVVQDWIERGRIDASEMYAIVADYRNTMNANEIITLIEIMHLK